MNVKSIKRIMKDVFHAGGRKKYDANFVEGRSIGY